MFSVSFVVTNQKKIWGQCILHIKESIEGLWNSVFLFQIENVFYSTFFCKFREGKCILWYLVKLFEYCTCWRYGDGFLCGKHCIMFNLRIETLQTLVRKADLKKPPPVTLGFAHYTLLTITFSGHKIKTCLLIGTLKVMICFSAIFLSPTPFTQNNF